MLATDAPADCDADGVGKVLVVPVGPPVLDEDGDVLGEPEAVGEFAVADGLPLAEGEPDVETDGREVALCRADSVGGGVGPLAV